MRPLPLRRAVPTRHVALIGILLLGLVLRLWGLDHGLPFVYHSDEARHFTNRAMGMFGGDFDPGYFRNPAAFTYLVHLALRGEQAFRLVMDGGDNPVARCLEDPSSTYRAGRVLAALLCMLGVVAVYAVGRRLWSTAEGVAAAAILSLSFLPVAYSRLALTDVAVLAPVAVAVYGAVRAREDGRLRFFLLAGMAAGMAAAFKYTAGLVAVPLLFAGLLSAPWRRSAVLNLSAATLAGALVFVATNPFFVVNLGQAIADLQSQSAAAHRPKLGQREESAHLFYLRSLTWGLGWGPALGTALGAVLVFRSSPTRGVLLALFPLLMFVCLSSGDRYVARWLMPIYPILALLAGVALAHIAARISPRPKVRAAALTALLLLALAQPLAADIRTAIVLTRADTRELASRFLVRALPQGTQVAVEPSLLRSRLRPWLTVGFGPPPRSQLRGSGPKRFLRSLAPERLDDYRLAGYCFVVAHGNVRNRLEARILPGAEAYYRRLERESTVIYRGDPLREGAPRPPFDFDLTMRLAYAPAFERPGPDVTVYRLNGCRPRRALTERRASPVLGAVTHRLCGRTHGHTA